MILTVLNNNLYNINYISSLCYNNLIYLKLIKYIKLLFNNNLTYFDKYKIIFFNKNLNIKFLNLYNFNFNNKYTNIIQIFLPIKILFLNYTTIIYYNLLLSEIPLLSKKNTLLLNNIKRVFISKLVKKEGIYFSKYLKGYFNVIYNIHIIFSNILFDINISFDSYKKVFYMYSKKFNICINFILFLNILGISNYKILYFSRYFNTFLYYNIFKNIKNYLYLNKNIIYLIKLFKFLLYNKFNILKELVNYLDILLDYSFNKKIFNQEDYFTNYKIITLNKEIYKYIYYNLINIFRRNTKNKLLIFQEKLLINPQIKFLEEINCVSEIINCLKISKNNFSFNNLFIRDININNTGLISLLDTNEGVSSGLILSLLTLINFNKEFKFLLYKNILNNKISPILYTIKHKDISYIIFDDIIVKKYIYFNNIFISLKDSTFNFCNIFKNYFYLIKITNLFNLSEQLIPFIFYNDPTRCFMSSKMQSQCIYSINKKKSYILTGTEYLINYNNNMLLCSIQEGIVTYVSNYKIIIRDIFNREISYYINKYINSNQNIIKYEKPLVWVGERINIGHLLVETNDIKQDEISLGNPLLVLYGSYFGYDYEDSLIISQNLLYNNLFTSLHIEIYETTFLYSNEKYEFSILNVPNISMYNQRNLNKFGIIKEGSKVLYNDILVSKIYKLNFFIKNTYNKLINTLFGKNICTIYNKSIFNRFNTIGRVIKLENYVFFSTNPYKKYLYIRIYIGKINLINIGDKLCGRHGNKGIVSYIIPKVDMPYSKINCIPDIITGSLGIPSRINIGQLYEGLLGISCFYINNRLLINSKLNTLLGINYLKSLIYEKLNKSCIYTSYNLIYNSYIPGKLLFKDGRTGIKLYSPMCFGLLQYFKLIHMVKDKIHYRTIGRYSNIIQQPIKGKVKGGGQRFGEMEVWALESYGSAYTIKELLNFRSDDIIARKELYNSIYTGYNYINKSKISETLKVLYKELQGLSLNINNFIIYSNINNSKYNINIFK